MPVSPPDPLVRTNYLSWPPGSYVAEADPDNPSYDPSLVLPSSGTPSNGNMATDEEQYIRPLERVHGMALHAPGVAWGMNISCTIGSPGVQVMAGIALDASGKHIYLAEGGNAEIGPDADVPGTPADPAPVTASGATLPTTGYTGDQYIAVQWWETWDSASYASDGVNQYNDTPWLQVITAGEYDPDVHVILGKVVLDGSGNVTKLTYGDVGGLQRTNVSIPAQSVQLQRAKNNGANGAGSTSWGTIRAAETGGIEIVTQSMNNTVNVIAGQTAFGVEASPSIVLDANDATATIGGGGSYGFVRVQDDDNNETMYLSSKNGAAYVQQLNAFQNGLIDCYTNLFHCHGTDFCLDGRSHKNNRALVDWGNKLIINFAGDYGDGVEITGNCALDNNLSVGGNTTIDGNLNVEGGANVNGPETVGGDLQVFGTIMDGNGVPLEANPTRKMAFRTELAGASDFGNWGNSNSTDIDLPQTTQFTAYAYMNFAQYYVSISYNAAGCAEIVSVDGNSTGSIITGNGILGNVSPSAANGRGKRITFRVRAGDDSLALSGTCLVFFE